jgi:hypothetical protein
MNRPLDGRKLTKTIKTNWASHTKKDIFWWGKSHKKNLVLKLNFKIIKIFWIAAKVFDFSYGFKDHVMIDSLVCN